MTTQTTPLVSNDSATLIAESRTDSAAVTTRSLLTCAVAGAPIFAVVSLVQAFTRQDFELTRNPLSQLSDGSLGWIQITNFLLTGALAVLGAAGLRRALAGSPGGTWVPRLFRVAGLGMMAAGVFRMDSGNGFPAGTPLGQPTSMSWHSDLHMTFATLAFVAIIATCFVLGRHYSRDGRRGYAAASRLSGLIFATGDVWAMAGGQAGSLTLCVGALTGMLWISVAAARLRSETTKLPRHADL